MKMYRNLKISVKLITGFIFIALIAILIGAVGLNSINRIQSVNGLLFEQNLGGMGYSGDSYGAYNGLQFNLLRYYHAKTEADQEATRKNIDKAITDIDNQIAGYTAVVNMDNEEIAKQFNENQANWELYKEKAQQALALTEQGKKEEAIPYFQSTEEIGAKLSNGFSNIMMLNYNDALTRFESNKTVKQQVTIVVLAICMFGAVVSVLLGFVLSRMIGKPINQMVEAADQIALGDVSVNLDIKTKDETGKLAASFTRMIENIRKQAYAAEKIADGDLTVEVEVRSDKDLLGKKLYELVQNNNEILADIAMASEQVASGAKQVSASSVELSHGATEQASAIEELTASLEEISSQTELNARNANQANELAVNAKENAAQGNSRMKEMLVAMEEINEASANISKVIKVIDDIAFQTNILALNAAVEAARAGQHGKGFAVVAEEVRNLAARSANAAKETTDMIEGSIKKAEGGTIIAKDTAAALSEIVNGVEQVANLVNNIAIASNEQAMGIAQINQGIMQVSQVVQTNSATSEESAAASEELSGQAALLKEAVGRYKLKRQFSHKKQAEELSPEVLAMLQNMYVQKKTGMSQEPGTTEAALSKTKIVLSDNEFGKY